MFPKIDFTTVHILYRCEKLNKAEKEGLIHFCVLYIVVYSMYRFDISLSGYFSTRSWFVDVYVALLCFTSYATRTSSQ